MGKAGAFIATISLALWISTSALAVTAKDRKQYHSTPRDYAGNQFKTTPDKVTANVHQGVPKPDKTDEQPVKKSSVKRILVTENFLIKKESLNLSLLFARHRILLLQQAVAKDIGK